MGQGPWNPGTQSRSCLADVSTCLPNKVSQMFSPSTLRMWYPDCLLVVFNLSPTTPSLPHVVSHLSPLPAVSQMSSNCVPIVFDLSPSCLSVVVQMWSPNCLRLPIVFACLSVVSQLSPRCHPGAASQMMSASCVQGFTACCLVVVIFPFSLR